MSSDKASKTEKATPKKVADARKKGQVAKSAEVSAWTTTLAMTLLLPLTFSRLRDHVLSLVARLPDLIEDPETGPALALFADGMRGGLLAIAPMSAGLLVIGVGANVAQVGLKPSPEALQPKLTKLNPLPGLKRMVGARSLWGGCKELLKLALLGGFAYESVSGFIPHLLSAGGLTLTSAERTSTSRPTATRR